MFYSKFTIKITLKHLIGLESAWYCSSHLVAQYLSFSWHRNSSQLIKNDVEHSVVDWWIQSSWWRIPKYNFVYCRITFYTQRFLIWTWGLEINILLSDRYTYKNSFHLIIISFFIYDLLLLMIFFLFIPIILLN